MSCDSLFQRASFARYIHCKVSKTMKAIENRSDIELLVNIFYQKVRADSLVGRIFDDIAHVNWDTHLPKMYDFWENILFGTANYHGNPMMPHLRLGLITPLTAIHFERWKLLFFETIDENFEGELAMQAKQRAEHISSVILHKVAVNQLLVKTPAFE